MAMALWESLLSTRPRSEKDEWNFSQAAQAITASPEREGDLDIWGEEMIENTVINEEIGIDTPQKNAAARVNIHLHHKDFYGHENIDLINLDEDCED
jgi:hypothetical protein